MLSAAGFDGTVADRFPNLNPHNPFEGSTSFPQLGLMSNSQQNHITGSENRAASSQASTSGFQFIQPSHQANVNNPYDDWSQNPFTEEEIRVRSHELLESDDMQQLLRLFSMGGGQNASMSMPEEAFTFPSFMPTPSNYNNSQDEDRARPGRAVVGWLKIKAAMRWGFFIRKKAAERRAQLVELELSLIHI